KSIDPLIMARMRSARVVVFGGSGFIGTNLLLQLKAMDCAITCCSRHGHRFRPPIPGVQYVEMDLTAMPVLRPILQDADVVYHLSSMSTPETAERSPALDLQDNVGWTLHMLKQCLEARVRKFVFVSSGGTVYGMPIITPIPETHPTDPISFHGVGKLAVEKYLAVLRRHGLNSVVVRPANVYGPHQDPNGRLGFIT